MDFHVHSATSSSSGAELVAAGSSGVAGAPRSAEDAVVVAPCTRFLAATWTNSRRRPELARLNWPARSWKRKDGPLIVADGYTGSEPPTSARQRLGARARSEPGGVAEVR